MTFVKVKINYKKINIMNSIGSGMAESSPLVKTIDEYPSWDLHCDKKHAMVLWWIFF